MMRQKPYHIYYSKLHINEKPYKVYIPPLPEPNLPPNRGNKMRELAKSLIVSVILIIAIGSVIWWWRDIYKLTHNETVETYVAKVPTPAVRNKTVATQTPVPEVAQNPVVAVTPVVPTPQQESVVPTVIETPASPPLPVMVDTATNEKTETPSAPKWIADGWETLDGKGLSAALDTWDNGLAKLPKDVIVILIRVYRGNSMGAERDLRALGQGNGAFLTRYNAAGGEKIYYMLSAPPSTMMDAEMERITGSKVYSDIPGNKTSIITVKDVTG